MKSRISMLVAALAFVCANAGYGSINVKGLGKVDRTPFFGSNVLYFELADGSSFIVRPSGTEPKIKVYLLVRGKSSEDSAAKVAKYSEYTETIGK